MSDENELDLWDTPEEETLRGLYYDREGRELGLREWGAKMEDAEYKRVALDRIGDVTVSTVWIGVNYRFEPGPPLIFETMVFGADNRQHDDYAEEQYATEAEALEGHKRIVEAVRKG